jgi:hypothetical protein
MRVTAFASTLALAYVLLAWLTWAHRDITRFIQVGRFFVAGPQHAGVHVVPRSGYDGQFYYRFALDPWHLAGRVGGIAVDSPIRRQRIFYSLVVWVLSGGGSAALVPWLLVAVNLAAVAALAYLGATFAQATGHDAWWGLAFLAFAGFVSSLTRDLTELLSSALILAALVALQRGRPWPGTASLVLAVLTRETAMLVVAALATDRIWRLLRRQARIGAVDAAWVLPGAAFLGWQLVVAHWYGTAPIRAERDNRGTPGGALAHALWRVVLHPAPASAVFGLGIVSLALLTVLALPSGRAVDAHPTLHLRIGLGLAVALAVSLSAQVWNGDPFELRTLAEVHLLGVALLLSTRRLRALAGYGALAVSCQLAIAGAVLLS